MRQAGHRDNRTHAKYYALMNPRADGLGSGFSGTPQMPVNARFYALTMTWTPEVYQSLLAKMMCKLKKRPYFAIIKGQLLALPL